MRLDEHIDDALRRLPLWAPPAAVSRRIASRVLASALDWPAPESRTRLWVGAAVEGGFAAGLACVAGWLVWEGAASAADPARQALDAYIRLLMAAAAQPVMQPLPLAWVCAALSLVTAFIFARRSLA